MGLFSRGILTVFPGKHFPPDVKHPLNQFCRRIARWSTSKYGRMGATTPVFVMPRLDLGISWRQLRRRLQSFLKVRKTGSSHLPEPEWRLYVGRCQDQV